MNGQIDKLRRRLTVLVTVRIRCLWIAVLPIIISNTEIQFHKPVRSQISETTHRHYGHQSISRLKNKPFTLSDKTSKGSATATQFVSNIVQVQEVKKILNADSL